jgi:hypothetical protein
MIECEFCKKDAMKDRSGIDPLLYDGLICCHDCFIAFMLLNAPEIKRLDI